MSAVPKEALRGVKAANDAGMLTPVETEWKRQIHDKLLEVMRGISSAPQRSQDSIIIFLNKKYACDATVQTLKRAGWSAVSIHGGTFWGTVCVCVCIM